MADTPRAGNAPLISYAVCAKKTHHRSIPSCHERKEKIAHDRQRELGLERGLIGVWSCVEACSTYRAAYDAQAGFPRLRPIYSRCKHLYFYYDHADYGFMSVRLPTWFPYGIQIALNGREGLRRALAKQGIPFVSHGNKFLHIADYSRAQKLLDTQINARGLPLLCGFRPQTFPAMDKMLGPHLSYYWTLWQSEWAMDYVFAAPGDLQPLLDALLRHALMTGTGERVLRYFGRPVDAAGQPHPLNSSSISPPDIFACHCCYSASGKNFSFCAPRRFMVYFSRFLSQYLIHQEPLKKQEDV